MRRIDAEDERWRVNVARVLLCAAIIVYLGILSALVVHDEYASRTSGIVFLSALIGFSAFGALALNWMRRTAIAAMALVGFCGGSLLVYGVLQLQSPIVFPTSLADQIETAVMVFAVASLGIPIVAFLVSWPTRRIANEGRSGPAITPDS